MSELILKHLYKSFQGTMAVQDLSFTVPTGQILSLLGPSGCGKSTTLQMIAGILQPDQGDIYLNQRSLRRVPPEKRGIALVLQQGVLFPHLTVGENVAFGLKMRGISRVEREQQALTMLRHVQLAGLAERKPAALSGGQAQRVALARALVIQPDVLLLDEPLSALDANLREDMQDLILTLQAQTGVTTLIVTHDQSEATVLSDQIVFMVQGQLQQMGSPTDFYQRPQSEQVARFFGGVNFWPALGSDRRLELKSGLVLTCETPVQGPVQVTIRPEQIQVSLQPIPKINVFSATVQSQRFTGTQYRLALQGPGSLTLQAWISPHQTFERNQSVWVHLPPAALRWFPRSPHDLDPTLAPVSFATF